MEKGEGSVLVIIQVTNYEFMAALIEDIYNGGVYWL